MMKKNKNYVKFRTTKCKNDIIDLLQEYNYYDYKRNRIEISDNSTLLVLEYRSSFKNVYQSITIIVSGFDQQTEVIIYESKSTISPSNILCVKKEVERILKYIKEKDIEIEVI
ncbi:MAG: hypothetical protein PQJ44_03010 [Sphaerochaetaceae bacterium]|nr:hypothetical protein [Sphaerochaetaceae bacterium]